MVVKAKDYDSEIADDGDDKQSYSSTPPRNVDWLVMTGCLGPDMALSLLPIRHG